MTTKTTVTNITLILEHLQIVLKTNIEDHIYIQLKINKSANRNEANTYETQEH